MSIKALETGALHRPCDPEAFDFETTADLKPLTEMIGQPRASEAVQFGIDIDREGYNIFVLGPPGTGKRSLVRQYLEKHAPVDEAPEDWCYVNNFDKQHKPVALSFPAGRGREFRDDMDNLFDDVRAALSDAFESEEHRERRQRLQDEFSDQQQETIEQLRDEARERGLHLQRTPAGLALVPLKEDGEPMGPDEVQELPDEKRQQIQDEAHELEKRAQRLAQEAPRQQREAQRKVRELEKETARQVIQPLVEELKEKYRDLEKVVRHIDRVAEDLQEQNEELVKLEQAEQAQEPQVGSEQMPIPRGLAESAIKRSYQVNLLVEHDPESKEAPIIYEDNPTYLRVMGRVEHRQQMGSLVADFNLIKPGALHKANGGYLILDMTRVLMQPLVWEGLKRALRSNAVDIESPTQAMGLMSTVSLEPEPIPLKIKVILIGSPLLYNLAHAVDPDFAELFKVPADFETAMDRDNGGQHDYARVIQTLSQKEGLRPFAAGAVARVIEQSARFAGDAQKLSLHMRRTADLLREADYWSRRNGSDHVQAEDVDRAVEAQVYRSNRIQQRFQEEIQRGTILIDTEDAEPGQVNALSVFPFGDFLFGRPSRITARTHIGPGKVIDIEREVELGEASHSKGVMILSGFLTGRFARNVPFALSASLVFEQSYSGIGGDSASLAELCALLSAIAGVPLKQSVAVTGSVNQRGEIQAIGAVNEKIEGFFDVCRARGLDGNHGVVIPDANTQHLMLRRDVIEAVEAGDFSVYAASTVDDVVELLTDMAAGEADENGEYPADTFNGRVMARLYELAEKRREMTPAHAARNGESF